MKRILHVESGEADGGSPESMRLTIAHLDPSQYRSYAVFANDTRTASRLRERGIPTFIVSHPLATRVDSWLRVTVYLLHGVARFLPWLYLPLYRVLYHTTIRRLERIVRDNHIDLIHLNISTARDLFGIMVAKATGVPCVSHIRSAKFVGFPKSAQRFANAHVCRYIAISDFIQKIWVGYGISKEKCVTVLNGIEPLPRKTHTSSKREGATFCTVGRLVWWKNHTWLLKSFAGVLKVHPDAHLTIIGGGPERAALESEAATLGVAASVTFAGEVVDPYELMQQSNIFVFPSRKEPFGRAVLEAMSLGMPIIAADSGGVPEFLEHRVTGLLVPLNDVDALTTAMRELASNGALCEQLAQAAREHATHELNIKRTVGQVEGVYRTCLPR